MQPTDIRSSRGVGLVELLVVVALIGTISAVAVMVTPATLIGMRADSGLTQLKDAMLRARNRAVAERRDMAVVFVAPNVIRIVRLPAAPGLQPQQVDEIALEYNLEFHLVPGLPDTPDGFGNAAPVDFGGVNQMVFRAEGIFTDGNPNLDPLNGTVFIAVRDDPLSARAATIFGSSALVRGFRWTGSQWID